jgi:uncharacterized protein (TIGR02569 family)
MVPPKHVRSAFGCTALPVPLPGGEGEASRCGDIVLKPCHDAAEAEWIAKLHLDITPDGFRLPQPVRSASGVWIVDGWQAWTLVEGHHSRSRWPEVIATCRAFHRATAAVSMSTSLAWRDSPFARADRIAWGEEPPEVAPSLRPIVDQLLALLEPIVLPSQLIHGDFTENVLFADGQPPAVIDVSPYWRPAAYAEAIVIVDALDWCGADTSILDLVADIPEIYQLMARAELFRLAILDGLSRDGADTLGSVSRHMGTVELLEDRIG